MMSRAARNFALVLILILAASFRLRGLAHDSLWGDEVCTVWLAKMPLADLIRGNMKWENIPPLHHLVLHFWIKLFGDGEFSVRMPSAIAGVAGVAMLYVLVRRLFNARVAVIAALLLAISPMHIAYSQECRSYAISVLLGLWSTDIFVRLLRRPASQRLHVAYVIVSTLGLYAHLYGIFTIAAHELFWLLGRSRLRPRAYLFDLVAIAALFSPWVPTVISWSRNVAANFWVKRVTLDEIAHAYWVYSGSTPVLLILIAMIVVGAAASRRVRRVRRGVVLMLLLTLIPVALPVVWSVLRHPVFAPRYGIIATAAMCALAAIAIDSVPRSIAAAALLALVILSPRGEAAQIPRADWRGVANFLTRNMRSGDLAVVHARGGTLVYDYYVHRDDVPRRGTDAGTIPVTLPLDGRRVWLVYFSPWYPLNSFLRRGNLRIEQRYVAGSILAVELTDDPPPPTSPTPSSTSPSPATRPRSPSP